ncbi:MAG TPA: FkbM family methyltransferase [Anaerolineaceae bacterium]|nr:FkbM family methyltransferase [Anaerolineaceae bacterium]
MKRFLRKVAYYLCSVVLLLVCVKNWSTLFSIFLGKAYTGLRWLKLRRANLTMAVTTKMEAWSVKESLLDRFYTRYSDPIQANWTIVDIGASIGEFCVEAALQAPDGRVIAFEPNPGSINILRQNVRVNSLKNVESYNVGIWKEKGEITLEIKHDESIQARTLDCDKDAGPDSRRTTIPVLSLNEMMKLIDADKIDLLKIDTEGTEFEILMSQPTEVLGRIERIILEVHERRPEKTVAQLGQFLESMGYKTRCHENYVHNHLYYLYAWRE